MKENFSLKRLILLAATLLIADATLRAQTVSEAPLEFYAVGDFNGDGQWDVAIVDKGTGRIRVGYRLTSEFFNWVNWRSSGSGLRTWGLTPAYATYT